MPELPEVEHARRWLDARATGRRLVAVDPCDGKAARASRSTRASDADPAALVALEALVGRVAEPPERRGKRLAWGFGDAGLLVHLGMTGHFTQREQPRFARLGLVFEGLPPIWFEDARRFGSVTPLPKAALAAALSDGLGPDPLRDGLSGEVLRERLRGRRPLKVALLDQEALAGLGNIHAAEALFRARIHPERAAGSLSAAEAEALSRAILDQLREHVVEGHDELVYVSEGGENPFAVYGREGAPCPRCGSAILRVVHAGRSTFFCAGCQRT